MPNAFPLPSRIHRMRRILGQILIALAVFLSGAEAMAGEARPAIRYVPSTHVFTVGRPIGTISPISTGGTVALWRIQPALPAGLLFDPLTGRLSGTATLPSPPRIHVVTGFNACGRANAALLIAVQDLPPRIDYSPSDYVLLRGEAMPALRPTSSGGRVLFFSIAPGLPRGLVFDVRTGQITGTPSTTSPARMYTVRAVNLAGSDRAHLTISVERRAQAPVIAYDPPARYLECGTVAGPIVPYSSGGAVKSYAVTPHLPEGLSLDPTTGVIGGTPRVSCATAVYTVTATNSGGTGTASLTLTVVPVPQAEQFLPVSVHPGDGWMRASVPVQPEMTYLWTVLPGTASADITSGQGTGAVGFAAAQSEGTFQLQASVQNRAGGYVTTTRTVTVRRGTWLVENGGPCVVAPYSTATRLPSGRVLVVGGDTRGGIHEDNRVSASASIYDPSTGLWTAVGRLGTGRFEHTATLLPDGTVLVAGGYGDRAQYLASAERFDPASGTWIVVGDLGVGRRKHTSTLLPDGKVLVAGGFGTSGLVADSEIYDPTTDTWTPAGPLGTARTGHTATLLPDGRVLIAGGLGTSGMAASAEIYDPARGVWNTAESLGTPRFDHTATLLPNGTVLVVGGQSPGHPAIAASEIFDPGTNTWAAGGFLGTARFSHTATLLPNGTVLAAGGLGPSGTLAGTEVFDPVAGTWTPTGDLATARREHTATLLPDGKLLAAGGNALASAEIYDPATGAWSPSAVNLGTPRRNHAATLLSDGRVLVSGGPGQSGTRSETFDPATGAWTPTVGGLGTARSNHTATLFLDGTVLVTGGDGTSGALDRSEIFDPSTGCWTPTGNLSTARTSHTAVLLQDGRVLVAGGEGPFGVLASTEIFDPATGHWTSAGDLGTARRFHTATRLPDGSVLVTGGLGASGYLGSAEIFHPATGIWTSASSLGTPRGLHVATALPGGMVLVTGGYREWGDAFYEYLGAAELYDPATGLWRTAGYLNTGRASHTATLLPDGRVLVGGGHGVYEQLADSELLDPATGTWTPAGLLNVAREAHTATLLQDGTVLVAFGLNGDVVSEIYQP